MTTELMTAPKSATTKKPCDCGCSGGGGECCELECLVQPRFFCGQLLADQDLTAIVDWVKAKSALQRFRDGWGVTCGLDVQCGGGGNVTVTPGYAIDCCGRDIVICKETSFNASDCWQRDPDPCREIGASKPTIGAAGTNPGSPRGMRIGNAMFQTGSPSTAMNDAFEWPDDVQAVDIFARYSESQSGARSTLSRGTSCGGGCEYTRVDEGGELYCRPAKGCEVPEDPYANWDAEYATESRRLATALIEAASKGDLEVFRAHIRRHGLYTFCFIAEWLCDIERKFKNEPQNPSLIEVLRRLVPWILQDWRNHRLIRPCTRCGTDSGVRLARVFLARKLNGGKESFTTLYVTSAPPFRRLLARDEWPVAEGSVNLAPYIWQPVPMVRQSLRAMHVNIVELDQAPPGAIRSEVILWSNDSEPTAYSMKDLCGMDRVGFFTSQVV